AFAAARAASGIRAVLAHDCYLFNLASPDERLRCRSTRALIDELERCARLGIPYLVTHPGAHCGAGEAAGLGAAARSLGEALGACRGYPATVAPENTAGQGTQIGVRFDQLARLVAETRDGDRLRVCVDTQHAFAAGYDMRSEEGYAAMVAELERTVAVERLVAFHLNDAKKGLGSRVDRPEHIGRGVLPRGGGVPRARARLTPARGGYPRRGRDGAWRPGAVPDRARPDRRDGGVRRRTAHLVRVHRHPARRRAGCGRRPPAVRPGDIQRDARGGMVERLAAAAAHRRHGSRRRSLHR